MIPTSRKHGNTQKWKRLKILPLSFWEKHIPGGPSEVDVVASYKIEGGKIAKAWFKMGPPKLLD